MSSIHYKLKSALEYKTLTFEGLHISVEELKREICDKENIRSESFDLNLSNAHTKRQYTADELIPRNSSVIVQRFPRENAAKLPKVHDTSTSGIVSKANAAADTTSGFIESEDFSKMTEEQRLAHIKEQSTQKYHPTNYQKTRGIMTGPPPPTYVCNKCGQTGHWYKLCPLLNIKRTTGIPAEELTPTTADDPLAMLHPSGKYMKPIMHEQARRLGKVEPDAASRSPQIEDIKPPDEYTCPLCHQMLRDAVLTICCGESFCLECIQSVMLEDAHRRCPGTNCGEPLSPESLVENKMIRKAVQNYWNSSASGQAGGSGVVGVSKPLTQSHSSALLQKLLPEYTKAAEPTRVRIGLASAISSGSPVQRQAVEADSSSSDLPDQSTASPPTSQPTAEPAKPALTDGVPQGANSPLVLPPVDFTKPPPLSIPQPFPPVNYPPASRGDSWRWPPIVGDHYPSSNEQHCHQCCPIASSKWCD
ncbi:Zinc knuckle family protein [Aphelenchoides avenae]|nr:Zinc knuckle family protein [Aphelenchus avenae]